MHGTVRVGGSCVFIGGVAHRRVTLPVEDGVLDGLLNLGVDREIDAVAAGTKLAVHLVAVFGGVVEAALLNHVVDDVLDGVLDKVRHVVHPCGGALFLDLYRIIGKCGFVLALVDIALLVHALEYSVGARVGDIHAVLDIGVAPRVIEIGAVGDARQHRALPQRQVLEIFAEIILRRRLHAIIRLSLRHGVEVGLQNLLLIVLGLQLHRKPGFLNFALVVALGCQQAHFDELLCQRAAALGGVAVHVAEERADDTLEVHAIVLHEAGVLGGDDGVLQVRRNFIQIGPLAVFHADEGRDELAFVVVDIACEFLLLELVHIQHRGRVHIAFGHADDGTHAGYADKQHREDQKLQGGEGNRQKRVGSLQSAAQKAAVRGLLLPAAIHRRGALRLSIQRCGSAAPRKGGASPRRFGAFIKAHRSRYILL